jgi:hypothetical protein
MAEKTKKEDFLALAYNGHFIAISVLPAMAAVYSCNASCYYMPTIGGIMQCMTLL